MPFLIALFLTFVPLSLFAQDRNVAIIILDDLGVDYLSDYHQLEWSPRTPNINSLRQRGALVSDAWSLPTCSPTRSAVLTGRYPFKTGVGYRVHPTRPQDSLRLSERTLPERIKQAKPNYKAANIGKWHVSTGHKDPLRQGYDFFSGTIAGVIDNYFSWKKNLNGTRIWVNNYHTTELVNDSIDWISRQSSPWLLWLAFIAPHHPLHIPPSNLITERPLGENMDINKYTLMIEALDTELGRLFEQINFDNTYVFLFGDNGTSTYLRQPPFQGLKGKGTLYQGGIHVPLIVAGPGIPAGSTIQGLVQLTDIHATILELLKIPYKGKDSLSFAKSLKDPSIPHNRKWNYSQIFNSDKVANRLPGQKTLDSITVRDSRFKLLIPEKGRTVFFDLNQDPFERNNLLRRPLSPEAHRSYKDLLPVARRIKRTTAITLARREHDKRQ
jgi:arylsulfatase A-like enzyme